jgi:MFS family permease
VAPWLQHVEKIDRPGVVQHLLVMGVALSVGALLLGWGADRLRRQGVPRETFLAIVAILFIAAQLALIMRAPMSTYVPWAIVAAVGAGTVISFAILTEYFPKEMSARANAALNILHLTGAFLLQYLTGIIVSLWPPEAGLPPAAAYQTAVGLCVVLQCGTLLWFLIMARVGRIPVFSAVPSTTQGMTATQQHAVDYRNAQFAIVRHVARARAQLAHWRRIAIASATVCVCLGVLFGNTIQSRVLAYVVEVPSASATLRSEYSARPQGSSVADLRNDCAMPAVISLRHASATGRR